MKFSIRELLLSFAIIGLCLGWSLDHVHLTNENTRLWDPPLAGSESAMDLFLRERAAPYNHGWFVRKAASLCFVPGHPLNKALVSAADKAAPTKDPRFPGGIEYEYWCDGQAPGEGNYCVHVIVAGSPPVIRDMTIFSYDY